MSTDAPLSAPPAASSLDSPLPSSVPPLAYWEPRDVEERDSETAFFEYPINWVEKLLNWASHLDLELLWVLQLDVAKQPVKHQSYGDSSAPNNDWTKHSLTHYRQFVSLWRLCACLLAHWTRPEASTVELTVSEWAMTLLASCSYRPLWTGWTAALKLITHT